MKSVGKSTHWLCRSCYCHWHWHLELPGDPGRTVGHLGRVLAHSAWRRGVRVTAASGRYGYPLVNLIMTL